ncbi:CRE-WRT-5 protein [Caenorhabditis remanei]|uniref:CRE-WRT-5 protein n=1 Tax=Caenorhabditis remanei TaxID=31234 RepID=E3N5K7_CAERE|nr:CRE-WRT-5 protein [Caenorhabditis remanei]
MRRLFLPTVTFILLLILQTTVTRADYCGEHKVPFGMEVHKNGNVNILCSRPNCHEKKYALQIRRGEYFEGDEQMDGDTVISFDLIGDIEQIKEPDGNFSYNLLIYRYHCGNIPDTPPAWYMKKQWPYWDKEQ